jgi:CRP-like cAMP-binding protein
MTVNYSVNKPKNGNGSFDIQNFLGSPAVRKTVLKFGIKEAIFSQGDISKDVMYIEAGHVKLSVVSKNGKEAVVAMLKPGDFVGVGVLAGQSSQVLTAVAATPVTLLSVSVKELTRLLHTEHAFADRFITYMVGRNSETEANLIDQLFNSSEKRLARALLLLARYGEVDRPRFVLPKVSQETLAEMIGTTRSRVNLFMKKFEKLGFLTHNGGLHVNDSLLSILLHD